MTSHPAALASAAAKTRNLYILDDKITTSVHCYVDEHVRWMANNCVALLVAAHISVDGRTNAEYRVRGLRETRSIAPLDHPWTRFAAEGSSNYRFVLLYLRALLLEHSMRFGTVNQMVYMHENLCKLPASIAQGPLGTLPQCVPAQYRRQNAVEAYREYYFATKKQMAVWSPPATKPRWWLELERRDENESVAH